MDGVSIIGKKSTECLLFQIDYISNELKNQIRANLAGLCHGGATVKSGGKGFTYKRALSEFLKRYNSKSSDTKKGMLGELLTHVLLLEHVDSYSAATPFFNMEERSIKKGFDVVLFDSENKCIWITEIKSGEGHSHPPDPKNKALLSRAKRDLKKRLSSNNSMLWYNAICGAHQAVAKKNLKKAVLDLLQNELVETQDNVASSTDQCVILGSVLFRELSEKISYASLKESHDAITDEALFKKLTIISFQKSTFKKLEQFLTSEAKS